MTQAFRYCAWRISAAIVLLLASLPELARRRTVSQYIGPRPLSAMLLQVEHTPACLILASHAIVPTLAA